MKTDLNQLLTRGDEYIVYYEKGSKLILSLELVSGAERFASDTERLRNLDLYAGRHDKKFDPRDVCLVGFSGLDVLKGNFDMLSLAENLY